MSQRRSHGRVPDQAYEYWRSRRLEDAVPLRPVGTRTPRSPTVATGRTTTAAWFTAHWSSATLKSDPVLLELQLSAEPQIHPVPNTM